MKTVKLSYSIVNAWSQGRYEDAVNLYLGGSIPMTPAIELGRIKDQLWSDYAYKNKRLHPELGGDELKGEIIVQQKYEKLFPFGDDYQILLRGVPDLVNLPAIRDFKCGMTTAAQYLDTFQMDYYKLLVPQAEVGFYDCFNPYTNERALGIKYLTTENAENALNHLFSFAGEIIDYLVMNKQLIDYVRS